jgi:Zn-dependent oligopeptidase
MMAVDSSHFSERVRKMAPFSWLKGDVKSNTGLFQIPELSTSDGFQILAERVVNKCEHLLDECFSTSRRKIVEILDEISDEICRVADLAEFIRHIDVDADVKQAAEQAYGVLHHLVEKMNTNIKLYEQAKQAFDNGEGDETDRRVLKLYLMDFERCGIRLSEKNRLNYLQLHISKVNIDKMLIENIEYQRKNCRTRYEQSKTLSIVENKQSRQLFLVRVRRTFIMYECTRIALCPIVVKLDFMIDIYG